MATQRDEHPRVVGAVLAAGASRRLGRPKQIATLDSEALVRRAVQALTGARCADVAIVVGAHAEVTTEAVADLGACVLANADWREGIAASIRIATAWAEARGADGLLLAACDQPFLTSAHVDALLNAYWSERGPVGSGYAGIVGIPAVFGRSQFPELMRLRGDRGAAALLRSGVGAVPWPEGVVDVDTEDALELARSLASAGAGSWTTEQGTKPPNVLAGLSPELAYLAAKHSRFLGVEPVLLPEGLVVAENTRVTVETLRMKGPEAEWIDLLRRFTEALR